MRTRLGLAVIAAGLGAAGAASAAGAAPPAEAVTATFVERVGGGALAERPRSVQSERWTLYFYDEKATGTWGERYQGDVRVEYADCREDTVNCVRRAWEGPLPQGALVADPLLDRVSLRAVVDGCAIDIEMRHDPESQEYPPHASGDAWSTTTYWSRDFTFTGALCGASIDSSWSAHSRVNRTTWTYTPLGLNPGIPSV